MNTCTDIELIILITFAISLIAGNLASSRMQKFAKLDGYDGPQWKLLLGDVSLPNSVLSDKGKFWRKVSITLFICLVISALTIGILNTEGSQCFGLNS